QCAHRGRPAKTAPPSMESGYRVVVDVEVLSNPEEDHGWTVLATTRRAETCADAEILQAYQEQHPMVEPGFGCIKHPAAISPCGSKSPNGLLLWRYPGHQLAGILHHPKAGAPLSPYA